VFEWNDNLVIDSVLRERTPIIAIAGLQESFLDQAVRADDQPVAREGRQGLVRRITVTRRTEGERLPPALACCPQAVHHREMRPALHRQCRKAKATK
jgi:hypothetical protein